ncbi:hypothetical protein OPKNFCMD_3349 [Methylobacterium crusticola]|uniref:Cell division protein FtsK n=1 Tax=Methylobacterium crusticola TaxID=1697972 RepID=A0ABQ4QZZ0_9HYPH|nr:hypothetical protein [Methylobacterium crusticola]GJD50606.1 hypothetical protein OPKNFCMD_3349 [Methylobacterium crusticola]
MLVYGETTRRCDPRERLAGLAALLREAAARPPGIGRHADLAGALIEAGEIAQGIADAALEARGDDAPSPAQDAATELLMDIARAVWASWRSGFAAGPAAFAPALARLAAAPLPDAVTTRWAEGFAFYALYPESYAIAAARSGLPAATRVVGIRSIGAPLGAMAAAGLGAGTVVTVRPVGHPFRRTLALGEALRGRITRDAPPCVAVADEGPGLSGSSFGAVIDALAGLGIPERRVALLPSHGGPPGPRSDAPARARWARMARHVAPFEDVVRQDGPGGGLAGWVADLVGPAEGPLVEVSGGRWRFRQGRDEAAWPPVHAQQERRKFLLAAGGGTWLLKFAGLGPGARAKADIARALSAAGFTPPVAGVRHGFLVERWIAAAPPLDLCAVDPDRLAEEVGRYLGFRARAFPAGPDRGARLADLLAMARHNVGEALGAGPARALDRWSPDRVEALARRARPIAIDGRMQAWEFLVRPDGRLLKCDALDHHATHDLVGCQDVAWDVAGAAVELDLPEAARARLAATVAREGGCPVDPDLLALLTPCYLAFRLGAASMAVEAAADPAEAGRLRGAGARYAERLERILGPGDG